MLSARVAAASSSCALRTSSVFLRFASCVLSSSTCERSVELIDEGVGVTLAASRLVPIESSPIASLMSILAGVAAVVVCRISTMRRLSSRSCKCSRRLRSSCDGVAGGVVRVESAKVVRLVCSLAIGSTVDEGGEDVESRSLTKIVLTSLSNSLDRR